MIEYRKLPKGNELFGKLGLGMGGGYRTPRPTKSKR